MKAKHDQTLPEVLTIQEVWRVLHGTKEFHNRVYFQTVYSCGLRLSEGRNLTLHDIDGKRMLVHVRLGKGGKDRFVPLPDTTYVLLRKYWATHRHPQDIANPLHRFPPPKVHSCALDDV